jgi:hypothetical protein
VKGSTDRAIRRTAVCVVRAEPRGTGLLFSVTGNTDIERHTLTQLYGHAADVDGTMELVRKFLGHVDAQHDLDHDANTYQEDDDDPPRE